MAIDDKTMRLWGNLALQFLNSAKIQANSIKESGNKWIITSSSPISEHDYKKTTAASDHAIGIPVIYSFYHGVELLLKGYLLASGKKIQKNHDLNKLFDAFKDASPSKPSLVALLSECLSVECMNEKSPIRKFCELNKVTPARFYEALRYPEAQNGGLLSHSPLKYNEKDGADFFDSLAISAEELINGFVALATESE